MKERANQIFIKHRTAWIIAVVVAVVYILGAAVFTFLTLPNTYVNGNNHGFRMVENVFESKEPDPVLTFEGVNGESLTIRGSQIDLAKEVVGKPEFKQNAWIWPIAFFTSRKYEVEYKTLLDEKKLDFLIIDSDFDLKGTLPKNAYVAVDGLKASIVPEQPGTRVVLEKLREDIATAFRGYERGKETTYRLTDIYVEPEIRADNKELKAELQQVRKIVSTKIVYDFDDRTYELGGDTLLGMYTHVDGQKRELNTDRLEDWLVNMAKETDTYGTTRTFKTTGAGTIEVPPGTYGWQMNVAKTMEDLIGRLDRGESGVIKPIYNLEGYCRKKNDIGDTYIEVDLSRQHLWAYMKGKLIYQSDIVSGMAYDGYATPKGVNMIVGMARNVTLEGLNFDRKTKYKTPVSYWMPIDYYGVGLHDAPWRGAFGGDIYQYGGSHGCINLPPEVAAFIYDNYDVHTPVVVYESSTDYSNNEKIN